MYRVGRLATKAAAKDSTDAQVVRFTCAEPLAKLSGSRMIVIATRKSPIEKRPASRRRSPSDRWILNKVGIGRIMRRMSVTMLRAPRIINWPRAWEQVPNHCEKGTAEAVGRRQTWVRCHLPVQVNGSAIGEGDHLDDNIGRCKNSPVKFHDFLSPWQPKKHTFIEDHHNSFLKPDTMSRV